VGPDVRDTCSKDEDGGADQLRSKTWDFLNLLISWIKMWACEEWGSDISPRQFRKQEPSRASQSMAWMAASRSHTTGL
jgi:hypothetical protein